MVHAWVIHLTCARVWICRVGGGTTLVILILYSSRLHINTDTHRSYMYKAHVMLREIGLDILVNVLYIATYESRYCMGIRQNYQITKHTR